MGPEPVVEPSPAWAAPVRKLSASCASQHHNDRAHEVLGSCLWRLRGVRGASEGPQKHVAPSANLRILFKVESSLRLGLASLRSFEWPRAVVANGEG